LGCVGPVGVCGPVGVVGPVRLCEATGAVLALVSAGVASAGGASGVSVVVSGVDSTDCDVSAGSAADSVSGAVWAKPTTGNSSCTVTTILMTAHSMMRRSLCIVAPLLIKIIFGVGEENLPHILTR
jgi:hypothetical protein